MEKCILRILNCKVEYGWSQQEALSQLQNLYELTNDAHIPHKTWPCVMRFLRKLGYENPRHYKICCATDHVTFIDRDACPNCGNPKDRCVDYFVLGLNLDSIFLSKQKIIDHFQHWNEKDEWFNLDNITVPLKEIWHGSRFRELLYCTI